MGRKTSPTEKVLEQLRQRKFLAQVVERWNPFAKPFGVRVDLFGAIDIVAIAPAPNVIVGVQATAVSGMSARRKKALEREFLPKWLDAGAEFWVFGLDRKAGRYKLDRARFSADRQSVVFDCGLTFADVAAAMERETGHAR